MSIYVALAVLAAQAGQPPAPLVQMTSSDGSVATMPLDAGASDARLEQASRLMAAGEQAGALPLLDAVIAEHEQKYRNDGRTIYFSARAPGEGIIYATVAGAAKKRRVVVLNGDWAEAYFLKGFALVDLNRSNEAIGWFDKAAALAPMNSQILAERAEWYKNRRDWKKAYDGFESARSAAGYAGDEDQQLDEGRALRGMAFVRIKEGKLEEAERLIAEALKLDPADTYAREELEVIAKMRKR